MKLLRSNDIVPDNLLAFTPYERDIRSTVDFIDHSCCPSLGMDEKVQNLLVWCFINRPTN